ncbi:NgoFVII family restriction endonuclease [Candidatus Saccharibacteria bacterium TM7i]|nr:NgoFVII family restriction endonuclease [Candidatus Saccharibacteria bacterium TM7i]
MQYNHEKVETYASSLAKVASLSNLFSESETPYLHYRTTEYLYSRIFEAKNLARSDITIDAALGNVGVGIKTFVYSGRPKFEKVAEFNKESALYNTLPDLDKVKKVSELRNKRIDFAGSIAGVDEYIYHCIARLPGQLFVFEDAMPRIDIDEIEITDRSGTTITFTDGIARYRFNTSKSTLFKEFFSEDGLFRKPVAILEDPFGLLDSMKLDESATIYNNDTNIESLDEGREHIILPLYSYKNDERVVFERSGLNQWNARGRKRDPNEAYILIPKKVRELYGDFLPDRNTPFDLHFPDGRVMSVKVSQDDGKALMSQHNADLGKWILRDVLNIKEGTLVTYEMLEAKGVDSGIDSVEISKIDGKYYIDVKQVGSYEEFISEAS